MLFAFAFCLRAILHTHSGVISGTNTISALCWRSISFLRANINFSIRINPDEIGGPLEAFLVREIRRTGESLEETFQISSISHQLRTIGASAENWMAEPVIVLPIQASSLAGNIVSQITVP